jgi:hypothetical protein
MKPWKHLLAVVLGVLPLYAGLVLLELRGEGALSVRAFVMYLAVISPLSIAVVVLLLRVLCGESLRSLNLKPGRWPRDLRHALLLSLVVLVANVISTWARPRRRWSGCSS